MKITALPGVGSEKRPCEQEIRVAAAMDTMAAMYGAAERARKGIPLNQCGIRGAFLVDGKPLCRAHAGAAALRHILNQ